MTSIRRIDNDNDKYTTVYKVAAMFSRYDATEAKNDPAKASQTFSVKAMVCDDDVRLAKTRREKRKINDKSSEWKIPCYQN